MKNYIELLNQVVQKNENNQYDGKHDIMLSCFLCYPNKNGTVQQTQKMELYSGNVMRKKQRGNGENDEISMD